MYFNAKKEECVQCTKNNTESLPVRVDHVVDHVALGDLLGPELLRRREVPAVVVAQVVVGHDARRLDARGHQKVHQHRLHLRLACRKQ